VDITARRKLRTAWCNAKSICGKPRKRRRRTEAHDDQEGVIDALNVRLAAAEQTLEQRRADVLAATQTFAAVQSEQRNAQRGLEEVSIA